MTGRPALASQIRKRFSIGVRGRARWHSSLTPCGTRDRTGRYFRPGGHPRQFHGPPAGGPNATTFPPWRCGAGGFPRRALSVLTASRAAARFGMIYPMVTVSPWPCCPADGIIILLLSGGDG